jgi:hypothetical protein
MFLRRGRTRSHGIAGGHGLLSLRFVPMRDGLPKLKDFPAEFGGSGEAMAE